ncbi:hypothetical protein SPSIL_041350 [Sporomusa silvacetica DSM 10669]|uniref:Uncharacterized protein n=1 Tax=Sporomusa silvacetica DSM 10669 TaxID=1123289 RepID=A0ABZ3IQC7_9FIRM|nr:hypothetical protein [Sporomusa silvacetica]OZC20397.1 hypothetical protein SPSIL_12640 [Sporomusa silvacetica DSM 10669]
MKTDSIIKNEGMSILIAKLGKVDAERFISLIIKEPFDYTKWQDAHFDTDMSIREFSKNAMKAISKV